MRLSCLIHYVPPTKKTSPWIFRIAQSKFNWFEWIFNYRILSTILSLYLAKCRSHACGWSCIAFQKCGTMLNIQSFCHTTTYISDKHIAGIEKNVRHLCWRMLQVIFITSQLHYAPFSRSWIHWLLGVYTHIRWLMHVSHFLVASTDYTT